VLEALSRPTSAHGSGAAAANLKRIQQGLLRSVGYWSEADQAQPMVLVMAGSGTSAMESALVNTVAPGETVVVVSQGFFGDRFATLGRACGARVEELGCAWGERVPIEAVERALEQSRAKVLTLTHVDTSNGVSSPVSEYAKVARAHGALVILDAVASLGGMPIEMEADGIGVVVTASQKALAMPPGLAIVVLSQSALERRRQMSGSGSYFLDWLNWLPPMEDPTAHYFATLPTNLLAAGASAIEIAETEGWGERFSRHRRMAVAVRRGLRALGMPTVSGDELLGTTVSALSVPSGVDPLALRDHVAAEGVAIATGLGAWSSDSVRVGHMGATSLPELLTGVAALEQALLRLGAPVERGAGVAELICGWEADT
jgi:aspartate aminotransferase-like enzyme